MNLIRCFSLFNSKNIKLLSHKVYPFHAKLLCCSFLIFGLSIDQTVRELLEHHIFSSPSYVKWVLNFSAIYLILAMAFEIMLTISNLINNLIDRNLSKIEIFFNSKKDLLVDSKLFRFFKKAFSKDFLIITRAIVDAALCFGAPVYLVIYLLNLSEELFKLFKAMQVSFNAILGIGIFVLVLFYLLSRLIESLKGDKQRE